MEIVEEEKEIEDMEEVEERKSNRKRNRNRKRKRCNHDSLVFVGMTLQLLYCLRVPLAFQFLRSLHYDASVSPNVWRDSKENVMMMSKFMSRIQ